MALTNKEIILTEMALRGDYRGCRHICRMAEKRNAGTERYESKVCYTNMEALQV